jgi:parvulin-like peptidyl-prolyl isomerase
MASDTYFEKAKTLMKKQKSIETVPSHQRWEGVKFTQRHPTPIIIF